MPRRSVALLVALLLLVAIAPPAQAIFPFPAGDPAADPYDYTRLHITEGDCGSPDLPPNFDCADDWKLSDHVAQPGDEDYDPLVVDNPQELFGVKGPATNQAWEVTTGRPDTVIAVMDSGIRWDEHRPNLVNKYALNRGELPVPGGDAKGGDLRTYDVNHDGVFNVADYAGDPRVTDLNGNSLLDPQDLIRTFSDAVDDDGNGYPDDISGWDFFEGDNDPNDDVDYGHGTGESEDSAGETGIDIDPQCPNCMLLEMRVGDSFVADVNHFAEAAVYATDNGASVIQSALGTLNHTAFAQAAADYAWENGVLFVASAADESAGHHNYPSALNHTMTVNSVTKFVDIEGVPVQSPKTYLSFNGCTNFGGYIWASVPSTSCSSDAVGQSSGMAGLVYSAARNAVDRGVIEPDASGRPLSASEAKQIFRLGADDIDFSTPKPPNGPPNNFATTLPASQRFVTTAGWDQISGWGRVNTDAMVRMVEAGAIPPEADITAPRWWQPLGTTGTVDVVGRVAAPRAGSYTYEVQWAPGVQPPRWPAADRWRTVAEGEGTEPTEGVLGTIDLATVRAALLTAPPPYTPADDPTSRDLPEKDAFRIRVVVRDDREDTGHAVEQRQAFALEQPGLLPGFPTFLAADGASSPAFDDLDGDGTDELVIADGNGLVHAYKADGTEARGWPVRTGRLPLPTSGDNAYTRGDVSGDVHAAILAGAPTVADLDGDGWAEVAQTDIEGDLRVWDHEGVLLDGFPVRPLARFSHEPGCHTGAAPACDDFAPHDARDELNTVDHAFTSTPSAGDLDPSYPGLELVAGSNDGHVYAWHADGTPVPGWPVLLRDPAKVAAVDPETHLVTYVDGAGAKFGRKVLATPTLGDVDGDGDLEVAVNVNEQYEETPNWSPVREPLLQAVAAVKPPGNTRTYLLHHDGTAHPQTEATAATTHPDDQAYVEGWPVKIGMLVLELLPYVAEGSNGPPVLADIDGDGTQEIGTASIASPPYLLRADGSSYYGTGPDGGFLTMASAAAEYKGAATDGPTFASLGGGAFGRLAPGGPPAFAMGSSGLRRLLDVIFPEQQLGAEDHLSAWDTTTGTFLPGFPAIVNDLMFFNTPSIADVSGDGLPEVLQSTAMYDLRAYGLGGVPALGFPKQTGGWSVMTPGVGDLDGDGALDVALATREGNLFVWSTAGDACQPLEWGKHQHDLRNTGAYGTDAERPSRILDLAVDGDTLRFTAPGDDGGCGTATAYRVLAGDEEIVVEAKPRPAGSAETIAVDMPDHGRRPVTVQAVDEAGNTGPPARVKPPKP